MLGAVLLGAVMLGAVLLGAVGVQPTRSGMASEYLNPLPVAVSINLHPTLNAVNETQMNRQPILHSFIHLSSYNTALVPFPIVLPTIYQIVLSGEHDLSL